MVSPVTTPLLYSESGLQCRRSADKLTCSVATAMMGFEYFREKRQAVTMTDIPERIAVLEQIARDTLAGLRGIRADLHDLRAGLHVQGADLRTEMQTLRTDLQSEVQAHGTDLRADMRTGFVDVRAEMQTQNTDLRGNTGQLRIDLHGDMSELRNNLRGGELRIDFRAELHRQHTNFLWLLGIMLGGFAGLLAVMTHGFKWL